MGQTAALRMGAGMDRIAWLAAGFLIVSPCAFAGPLACAPSPLVLATALGGCSYGPPVISGESVLLPKVCLHDSGGGKVVRHSVEARSLQTGARQNQAALPAQPTTTDALPAPGTVLPGAQALLVVPQGIAACDFQRGSAELVYEAQGLLLGAARSGDVLALVESLPAEGKGKPARLEWTVLDLEAASVLGQVLLAGASIDGVALQRKGAAITAILWQQIGGRRQQVSAAVYSDAGKPMAKDGDLTLQVTKSAESASPVGNWPLQGFCPVALADRGALVGRPAMVVLGAAGAVSGRGASVDPAQVEQLALPGADTCLGAALASGATRGAAWLKTDKGAVVLRAMHCR